MRILERGMDYSDPLARQDDRIGGGHPEGLFEAWSNLYRRFAIAMDAADRRDEALLADFWYPDARAGAFGVRWVENCVRSADNGACWSTSANPPAQGVRPEPLRLFFLSAPAGFYPPHGRDPPAPGTLRRHSIAREPAAPAYRALIDLQFAEVA